MTVCKIKVYRGAKILVLNDDWQTFIYVIFYKGQFYANNIAVTKRGEYTNKEYMEALEAVLNVAHKVIDKLKQERSLIYKFKQLCQLKTAKPNTNQLIEKNPSQAKE